MSNELVQLTDKQKQILAMATSGVLTGQSNSGGMPFKTLRMVQEMGVETPAGVSVPLGSFHIPDTELFGSSCTFRPLVIVNKLAKRLGQEDNFKVDGETIYFFNWNQEIIDNKGGIALGKVIGKAAKELSPQEQETNKDKADTYLHVFGIVKFNDEDQGTLCLLSVRGGKYSRVSSVMNDRKALGKNLASQFEYVLKLVLPKDDPNLSAKERKEAKNTYFNITVTRELTEPLPLEPVIGDIEVVMNYIEVHNKAIHEKHIVARQNGSSVDYYDADYEEINAVAEALEG